MLAKIHQAVQDATPAAAIPPPVVAGLTLFGVPLADWVLIATLLYTLLLIANNAVSLYQKMKGWCTRGTRK